MSQRVGLHRGRLVLFVYGELATQFLGCGGIVGGASKAGVPTKIAAAASLIAKKKGAQEGSRHAKSGIYLAETARFLSD
jgi:hypothetical protein